MEQFGSRKVIFVIRAKFLLEKVCRIKAVGKRCEVFPDVKGTEILCSGASVECLRWLRSIPRCEGD